MNAHKGGTKDFADLDYQEQARSINAQILNLEASIKHHIDHAPNHGKVKSEVKDKCVKQVVGSLCRVNVIVI